MIVSRRSFGLLFVAAASIAYGQQDLRVWALGDGLRVDPVAGRLLESRPDIHKDYPAGAQHVRNAVWDSGSRTVALTAARNEFVAFQLILEAPNGAQEVDVSFQALEHSSGRRITGQNLAIFKEWYVHVERPTGAYERTSLGPAWYPDALVPKRAAVLAAGGFPFAIPDPSNRVPGQKNQAVWIDVFVPAEPSAAPAGRYTGNVSITWKGGQENIAVELDVWDFALPQESHLRGDVWNNSMLNMPPDEEMRYYQLCRQHRFLPLVYAYRPKLNVRGTDVTIDWTEYDKRLAPYIDGSAFTARHGYWGPGSGLPISHVMLPFDIKRKHGTAWPIDVPAGGPTPEYERVWKETGRLVREHMDANPHWRKIMKVAFLNGLDESYNEEAYGLMLYYGRLLHDAMGRGWFKYRVDGGYSRSAVSKLAAEVELLVAHTQSLEPEYFAEYRKLGIDTWFYGPMMYPERRAGCGTNTFVDQDLLMARSIPWTAWKYGSGWVQWEFDFRAYSAWYDPETVKQPNRACNGSGHLIYRRSEERRVGKDCR